MRVRNLLLTVSPCVLLLCCLLFCTAARAEVILSTDLLGTGTFGNGHTNGTTVEIIRQIPNAAVQAPTPYTSDLGGPTIDFSAQGLLATGNTAGGFGSDQHGRGGNLWIKGDGDLNVPHVGFGGHANWLITFDLDDIRAEKMGGAAGPLQLTGKYGSWGGIGNNGATAGVTQGAIYLDGTRIDTLAETTHNIPTPGGNDSPSQAFDLNLPVGAKYLTLTILSGPTSTLWDDANYRDVVLDVSEIPEPSTFVLAALGLLGLLGLGRRRKRS